MRTLFLACLFILPAAQPVWSQQYPVTVEEYSRLRLPAEVRVSPQGGAAAFTVTAADLDADVYATTLFVWTRGGGARQVALGHVHVGSPRWSPDGTGLGFLSSRPATDPGNARAQIWLVRPGSSDVAVQLSDTPGGVLEFGWGPDGSIFALTVNEAGGEREFWKIEVPQGTADHIWSGDAGIRDMAVSPDGEWIAFSTNGSGTAADYLNYNLRLLNLESKRARELTSRPGPEVAPTWSPDSRVIAFRALQNPRFPFSQGELFTVPASGGRPVNLTNSFDRSVIEHIWSPAGSLLFTAAMGAHTQIFAARENGAIEQVAAGNFNYYSPHTSADGTVYVVRQSGAEPAELWRLDARPRQLTRLNALTAGWKLGKQEVVAWTAPDGLSLEGLLIYPAKFVDGRRYPLLVSLTGGPRSRALDVMDQRDRYQLFSAHGYAVLAPNFRGSAGYGEGFATADRAELAGGDLVDILAGVDHVISMGVADSTRFAVFGGASGAYGAYLTSWAVTQTPRFQAAIVDFDSRDPAALPQAPTQPAGELFEAGYMDVLERQRAPADYVGQVQTPLLILEGLDDSRSLVSRAQRLYRSLSDIGRTVQLVELERETETPRDRDAAFYRQLRWFDKYLKFGGAELFDFYLVGEPVPGPGGWLLRVTGAEPRSDYSGLRPDSGRYLEVTLRFEPPDDAGALLQDLDLDPGAAVTLLARDSTAHPLAGTVTEVFSYETLILGSPAAIRVPVGAGRPPAAVSVRLAFEIPGQAAEYRLRITGFVPVRVWVPAQ